MGLNENDFKCLIFINMQTVHHAICMTLAVLSVERGEKVRLTERETEGDGER